MHKLLPLTHIGRHLLADRIKKFLSESIKRHWAKLSRAPHRTPPFTTKDIAPGINDLEGHYYRLVRRHYKKISYYSGTKSVCRSKKPWVILITHGLPRVPRPWENASSVTLPTAIKAHCSYPRPNLG